MFVQGLVVVLLFASGTCLSLYGTSVNASLMKFDVETLEMSSFSFASSKVRTWVSNLIVESPGVFGGIAVMEPGPNASWVTFTENSLLTVAPLPDLSKYGSFEDSSAMFVGVLVTKLKDRTFFWVAVNLASNTTLVEMVGHGQSLSLKQRFTVNASAFSSFTSGGELVIGTFNSGDASSGTAEMGFSFFNVSSGATQENVQNDEFPFDLADPTQYYFANSSGNVLWIAPSTISLQGVLYTLVCADEFCNPVIIGFLPPPAFPVGSCSALLNDSELLLFVTPVTLDIWDIQSNVTFARVNLGDASIKRATQELPNDKISLLVNVLGSCVLM